jgi:hypothetical protein
MDTPESSEFPLIPRRMLMPRLRLLPALSILLFPILASQILHADGPDLDTYKFRVQANWWFSHPSGSFTGKDNSGSFDVDKDLGFGNYSTFSGAVDWRFTRKNHLTFGSAPVNSSKRLTLKKDIEFQGYTFAAGSTVSTSINSNAYVPGYQYDIIRRNHGYLAGTAQMELLDTSASIEGTVTVNGQTQTQTASGSFFAPLPIIGTHGMWYPMSKSDRVSLEGILTGMYFFGYGNFIAARGNVGFGLSKHWRTELGYQMGSRLSIHGTTDNIGLRLTQKGPTAGIAVHW